MPPNLPQESHHDAFSLYEPAQQSAAAVFSSPHSGRFYPQSFLEQTILNEKAIRSSEDFQIDRIFARAPRFGAPLLTARLPRAYVDLNRAADELDPAVIEGITYSNLNPRISAGLGVIPRVVSRARAIYSGKLSPTEAHNRLEQVWQPYHQRLSKLIAQTRQKFGHCLVIDCHSMPHEAVRLQAKNGTAPSDIILGDRYGASADADLVAMIEEKLRTSGFSVTRNTPFAGAYIAQHYGRPSLGVSAIQIEIDRSLYMNEEDLSLKEDFASFQEQINNSIQMIMLELQNEKRLAAE